MMVVRQNILSTIMRKSLKIFYTNDKFDKRQNILSIIMLKNVKLSYTNDKLHLAEILVWYSYSANAMDIKKIIVSE